MPDPADLYELVAEPSDPDDAEDAPAAESVKLADGSRGPVLLYALDGFLDAGSSAQLAATHLIESLDIRELARFDTDLLHDYRARRPPMVFIEDHYESYTAPELILYELRDTTGTRFLLLNGPEPDVLWERFTKAVIQLVEAFDVRLSISLGGVPMTVPHTRPTTFTTHATRPELVKRPNVWRGKLRIPGSVTSLIDIRLGEAGRDAMGFVAHIPHYLASVEFPQASAALLDAVAEETGLLLPVGPLYQAGVARLREIDSQLADDEQAQGVVHALEEQYDAFVTARGDAGAGDGTGMPDAEELGAELERFLAQLDRTDED